MEPPYYALVTCDKRVTLEHHRPYSSAAISLCSRRCRAWPRRALRSRKLASWALRAECRAFSWWFRRDLGDGSSERQGAQLSTAPSGPGVRWRLWPLLRQHCGKEASFFRP